MSGPLTVTTRRVEDAGDLLRRLPERHGMAWVRLGDGLVGAGVAHRLSPGTGPERFARLRDELASLAAEARVVDEVEVPGTGLVAFTSVTFSADSAGSVGLVPRVVVGRRDGTTWVTTATHDDAAPGSLDELMPDLGDAPPPQDRPRYAGSSLPDLHWLVGVANAVERMQADPAALDGPDVLEKVVLARDHALWARAPFRVRGVADRLARHFPDCFTFVVDGLVGATPELLLRRYGERVWSEALAGTAPRGDQPERDRRLGDGLLASAKDAHEHRLAADSVAAVLGPACRELERSDVHLKRLENVQHLATTFHGTLDRPRHVLDLVAELHPTAAVGGTPTAVAVAVIAELEGMDRGRYSGPVGWFDADGDGELGIALRCAELSGARARLFAGGGIVAASLPEDELEETRVKLRAMQSVLGDG